MEIIFFRKLDSFALMTSGCHRVIGAFDPIQFSFFLHSFFPQAIFRLFSSHILVISWWCSFDIILFSSWTQWSHFYSFGRSFLNYLINFPSSIVELLCFFFFFSWNLCYLDRSFLTNLALLKITILHLISLPPPFF